MNLKRICPRLVKVKGVEGYCGCIASSMVFFARPSNFALRPKMLKSTIARHPAILLDLINRASVATDCNLLILIHVNSKHERRKWPVK